MVQSRVPAVPQGLCAGAGPLLPARLSTQPGQGDAQGLRGEAAGGRSPPAGQGPAAGGRLLPGAACSQIYSTVRVYPNCARRQEANQGLDASISAFLILCF